MSPINRHASSTRHQYLAQIEWDDNGVTRTSSWSGLHNGSIDAIHAVHCFAQREQELDAERKVRRPRLKPEQYRVNDLRLTYMDETRPEKIRRQEYVPVPSGPNPDVRRHNHPKPEINEFPFVAGISQSQT